MEGWQAAGVQKVGCLLEQWPGCPDGWL